MIFSCGAQEFTARDVLDWAQAQGELAPLWSNFLRAGECERVALERELEADGDAISEASVAFRYAHDLITAEETERWLEARGLTLQDFGEYFERQHWFGLLRDDVAAPEGQFLSASAEEQEEFVAEITLSGQLDRLAEQLSFRVAAQAEEGGDQSAFERQRQNAITEKSLERELQGMRLNLTRFELEAIEVDSHDAAAEVIACVKSDGMQMEEVAEESRYPFRRSELLLEDMPADRQQTFLSVRGGTLLEPLAREDGFEVCRVKSRVDPELSDSRIRERLANEITRRHFAALVSKHIAWKLSQAAKDE
ncbi:MAG: hypothetical protein JO354_05555 [Verrucomicrobia bacterium]|nr:hypothetical protein [Verrucomicrobiota bacterium]